MAQEFVVQPMAVEAFELIGLEMAYVYTFGLFNGVTQTTLDLALPRNALVDRVKLRLQARRVDSTQVQQVAQVRSYSQAGGHELVIDFGTPRTVSGVSLPSGVNVLGVHAWLGSQFNPLSALIGSAAASASVSFPELRTERLRVRTSAALSAAQLPTVRLHLPEPPSGLAIAVDGGAPVWTHPEPVQPRADVAQPDEAGWDADSRRIVDLTEAIAALAGDPLAGDEAVNFQLTLSTAVPCQLALAFEGGVVYRRIRRVRFGGDTATTIDFDAEGRVELPLPLPPPPAGVTRQPSELRWVAEGELPALRTVPAIGPDAALGDAGAALAEALVTPDSAAIVRLPAGTGIETLQAVRMPLRALGDGAEARLVLWSHGGDAVSGVPLEPLPQGSSEPVTLVSGPDEAWVTFAFPKPPTLDTGPSAAMPWAALIVSRGTLSWALAAAGGSDALLLNQQRLRRGPPNGPWKALPAPLQSAAGVLDARGRLRLQGLAAKAAPLPPLTLALAGSAVQAALHPRPKGEAGLLRPGAGAGTSIRLTSHVAGRLRLRDIDVVSDV